MSSKRQGDTKEVFGSKQVRATRKHDFFTEFRSQIEMDLKKV